MSEEVCNYASMIKDIIDEKYVIFAVTTDPESLEIFYCIRASGLEQLCYKHMNTVYMHESLEFLKNLKETDNK